MTAYKKQKEEAEMQKENRIFLTKEQKISYALLIAAAIMITWTGIVWKQQVFRIIPLYVSLFVGMLQSRANRYACLIGGVNSLIYTVVYFSLGLYAMALQALLISCPFQLFTFVRWHKNAYKHSTKFRQLNGKQGLLLVALYVFSFLVLYWVMSQAGSSYRMLDNALTLLGIFVSILTLLSFREYTWLMLGSGICSIVLDVTMMQEHPGQITYLVFSVYSMICMIRQFISVKNLYKEQKKAALSTNL